ncbi:hypothetical protein TNCV_2261041 [Trichonephila clavipes]|nr:hypothetical protein TNCV_2261041 [Trichonephila clavipes]
MEARAQLMWLWHTKHCWKVLKHSHYSSDLLPCDYLIFCQFRETLKRRRFDVDDVVPAAVLKIGFRTNTGALTSVSILSWSVWTLVPTYRVTLSSLHLLHWEVFQHSHYGSDFCHVTTSFSTHSRKL